jgi:hypothetical protein
MGFVKSPAQYEEKNLYFPRSDSCDDPKQTDPIEVVRKVPQDVEWVPIIEVPKCTKVPPREEVPPPPAENPPPPAPIKPVTGPGAASTGASTTGTGSSGSAGTGGASSGPPAGSTQDPTAKAQAYQDKKKEIDQAKGSGGRQPSGDPVKPQKKNNRGPSGKGGGGGGGSQGDDPPPPPRHGKYVRPTPCNCDNPPVALQRKKTNYAARKAIAEAQAAAASKRKNGGDNAAQASSWARKWGELEAVIDAQIEAWKAKCRERVASDPKCNPGAEADAGSKKFDPTRPDSPIPAMQGVNDQIDGLVSAESGNTHDYAASTATMPNQAALPGDWKGEYNPSDEVGDIILPAAAVVPQDGLPYTGTDEPDRAGGDPADLPAGDATGTKNPNAQGQDTPCRYVIPVPNYAGTEEQVAVQTINPYNTPSAITDGGFPFANNALPVIDIATGVLSQPFYEALVLQWLLSEDEDELANLGTMTANVADQFATLVMEANGAELGVTDMAGALLAGILDGDDATNEQFANAVQIISAVLLSQPRYLGMSANPAYDHRFGMDNGNFTPSANRAIAYNGLPVAAPTPSGFNVGFNPQVDNKVFDGNVYRDVFNSNIAGTGGGSKLSGNIGGVLIEDKIPVSNNIITDANGLRMPDGGRLETNQLAPLIDSNANVDIDPRLQQQIQELEDEIAALTNKQIEADAANDQATVSGLQDQIDAINLQIQGLKTEIANNSFNEFVTIQNELIAAIAQYQTDQAIWQDAYDARKLLPNDSSIQAAEGAAKATVRADEENIKLLQNKLSLAYTQRSGQSAIGDVPDPNPSGLALPQPFIGQDADALIPSFSFELLQYEMANVQAQIINVFDSASQFISDLQSALNDTVGRQTSNVISWQRNVDLARVLRQAATNEFNKQVNRLITQLGGGINVDGTFEQNLSNAVLQDGGGRARIAADADTDPVQYAADLASVTAALSLAYTNAGLNNVLLSGTATVPPTDGSDLTDQQIADELGLGEQNILETLPEDIASKFVDMSQNAQQLGLETIGLNDLNDTTVANQITRSGLRYQPLKNMVQAWCSVQPIQFPKKLSIWMFGGTLETKTFENTWVSATYRGVLNRLMLADVDKSIMVNQQAATIVALKQQMAGVYDSLQQAKVVAKVQSIRDSLDPIRVAADNDVTNYQEQFDNLTTQLQDSQTAYDQMRRDEASNPLTTGQWMQRAISDETQFDAATITLALGTIDSITTQWIGAQNTGFAEDKFNYLFKFFENKQEINFQSQALTVKSILDRFLNVLIGRYKLLRDSVQNSDDNTSLPVVVDYQPGVISDSTPVGAAYNAVRPLAVVYDVSPPTLTNKSGNVIGGGLQPGKDMLPMFSLNPDFAYFQTDIIKEEFVSATSWDVVEKYMIPELLAPGCTYSNVMPSPNAPEIHCLVNNAPFSFDVIITVPDYVSGEIRAQILDGFYTMMRHFVGLFNGSTNNQGLKNDENLNTQIAVKFKYGNTDTFRLPRPLQAFEKLLGGNQAAVTINIPAWDELFAAGYNIGTYGSMYFDIAYKALRDGIKWARTYASNVETHLNQSVRAKMPNKLVENDLPVPAGLNPADPHDFRMVTTVTETPDQNHAIDPTDLSFYSMDIDVDFGSAFANLDIAGFGKIDSGAAGKFRNYFLHRIMPLRSSDNVNALLFGGEPVFFANKPMRLAFHSLSSFFFAKAPFSADNLPRWRFGFSFGWDKDTSGPFASDNLLPNYFHAKDEPRTNAIKADGNKFNFTVSGIAPILPQPLLTLSGDSLNNNKSIRAVGRTGEYVPFLIENAPWDIPDVPLPAIATVDRSGDVMRADDFVGRALERFIQKIVFEYLESLRENALTSFAGTTVLWASNYGLLDQQILLTLIDKNGVSQFPDKIQTLALDDQTLAVYPVNQPMYEEALQQSTINTGRGPVTTEFQANNLGVLVTPEKHGNAPANAVWIPSGSNFGKNIPFATFVDQLDQIINTQHAYNAMLSRGDWSGQHVLAKVIEKSGVAVVVIPITFDGRAAATTRINGRYKVNAMILGLESDIKVGDEVWLSHDLSNQRIPFVWPSPRTGNQNVNMSAVDVPTFSAVDLGNIPFLGQNAAGQFDGSGIIGNIYENLLPSVINTVNKLIAKGKFNNIETGEMTVTDGIGFIVLENTYVGDPQVHLEIGTILSDPPGYESFVKALVYARVADTIEVRFYDSTTGNLAVKYDDTVKYMIVGSTVATGSVGSNSVQTNMFRDAGARN